MADADLIALIAAIPTLGGMRVRREAIGITGLDPTRGTTIGAIQATILSKTGSGRTEVHHRST